MFDVPKEIKATLMQEFLLIAEDLKKLYEQKGMRASGKFAQTLEVLAGETTVKLIGEDYAQQLELGRRPGKFGPIEKIRKWILDKGVFADAIEKIGMSSLAFLIGRKIAREGWNRAKHGGVNLISEVITEQRIQSIIDKVGGKLIVTYSTEIIGLMTNLQPV